MRGAGLLLVLGVFAACGRDALPPQLAIERVVAQLAPPLTDGVAVEEPMAGAVRRAVIAPGEPRSGGGPRDSLVAPLRHACAFTWTSRLTRGCNSEPASKVRSGAIRGSAESRFA